jgi:hypothetical protein
MCRHCYHKDLKPLRDHIVAQFDLSAFDGDRRRMRTAIESEIRKVKREQKAIRRSRHSAYRIDYMRDLLSFAAFVLNDPKWDNGGNFFVA